MESILMVNKSTIMAPKETFKSAMEFLDKNNPSCSLYSTDGYKINVHKEVMIQTSFLRGLLSNSPYSSENHMEVLLTFVDDAEKLELIAKFLYTGKVICDDFEVAKDIFKILIEDLGFPLECDATCNNTIECPMEDCQEYPECHNLLNHYVEDVFEELENRANDIDIRKSVKCRICKEVINYISESEESDRFNVLQHYIDHEKSLKEYIDYNTGYKEQRKMEILGFFSEQKKKYLKKSIQEDLPEEPESNLEEPEKLAIVKLLPLAITNPNNDKTSDMESKNDTEEVQKSQSDMGDLVEEDSSDRWLYLDEEEDWDLLEAYEAEDVNLQMDEEIIENDENTNNDGLDKINFKSIDVKIPDEIAGGISSSILPNDDFAWSCDKCRKSFPSKQRLHIHKYCEHRISKYYSRNSCSSRSQNKPRITIRNKTNALVCDICDTSFPTVSRLKKHIFDVHKVPYRGPKFQQGKTFSFNPHAKPLSPVHQNIPHEKKNQNLENSHICDICDKTFGQQMLLRIHRDYIHGVHET